MPNINLDDAYILGETGAQVDKVTGLFTKDEDTTSGEKAFAQLNIGTAGSNRNLLDNPWFGSGEVVNQRRNTSGTVNNAYFIDRWKLSGAYSIAASGITFTCNAGAGFSQIFNHALTIGGTYTFSVKYADSSIVSVTFSPLANRENVYQFGDGLYLEIDTRSAFPTHRCIVYTPGTSWTREIMAVKLELGSVSTLANDAPPDYGEELAKCQYYFRRWSSPSGSSAIGLALAVGTTNANFALLSSLRASGSATISFSGLVLSDGTDHAVTNVTVAGAGDGATMRLLLTSTGLTAFRAYTCQISAGGHLDVSKDL